MAACAGWEAVHAADLTNLKACVTPSRLPLSALIEEAQDLAARVLPPRLLVVHDAVGRREDDVAEGTSGQQVHDPLLNLIVAHIKAGADHAALVDAANQIYDNFAGAVVVHHLELPDVACARARQWPVSAVPGECRAR